MILPSKHVNFAESLLGFGSYLLQRLEKPLSVDDIWRIYQSDLNDGYYYAKQSFDNLILTLIFLYSIQAIKEEKGLIYKCN